MTITKPQARGDADLVIVGVAMGHYDCSERYGELPKTEHLLREVAKKLLAKATLIVNKPLSELPGELRQALPRAEFTNQPLIVIWSGHGVLVAGAHRLIVSSTADPTMNDTYDPAALAELAARTGADQILLIIDTCYSAAGILVAMETVGSITDAAMRSEKVWMGVLAASQSYGKARDGALLSHLRDLLSEGPKTAGERSVWGPYNRFVRGDEFLHTAAVEWPTDDREQIIQQINRGLPRSFIPNPCWVENAPRELVAHLVLASRGADHGEDAWYFSGRRRPLEIIVDRIKDRSPGLVVVTGPAGSGKSAILGRIGALSDREEREHICQHAALDDSDPDPGLRSVDANLNLRNLTSEGFIRQLGDQLRPDARTIWALMDWSVQQSRTPVVLLDGLDEAGAEARRVAEDVAQLGQVCCVLVATRSFEMSAETMATARSLPELLSGPSSMILDLANEAREVVRDDIRTYARKRLTGHIADASLDGIVDEVSQLAMDDEHGGSFLLARVLTSQIRENPGIDPRDLSRSLEQAFEEDVGRWPEIKRGGRILVDGARDLLFALAFAAGDGFPARDVWPAVATALSERGTVFTETDVHELIGLYGEYYGRYIVASSEDGQAVYRLYHRRLVDHLRGAIEIEDHRAVKVYRAIEDLAARQIGVVK